jgi:hypothetical protein
LLQVRIRADFFDPPAREFAGQHQMKPFAERLAAGPASQFAAGGSGEIRKLQFGGGFGEALGDERQTVAALLSHTRDLADEIAALVPRLEDDPAIPFGHAPVIGEQR